MSLTFRLILPQESASPWSHIDNGKNCPELPTVRNYPDFFYTYKRCTNLMTDLNALISYINIRSFACQVKETFLHRVQ